MALHVLEKDYQQALEELAYMLRLNYGEIASFCGDVEDAAFGARRLKEFFKAPPVSETLDTIVRISEEYRHLSGGEKEEAGIWR